MPFSLCGSVGANTGAIKCDRRRGIPKKVIVGGAEFDSNDYATQSAFDTAFLAAFKLATGSAEKLFPFPEITGVSDGTEANKEATLGAFGPKVVLIEGKPSYTFDVLAGTTLEKALRKFNGQQVPVFILDDSNAVWGKLSSAGVFSGTDVLIFTSPHKFGDGSNGQTTKVTISFVSASDLYDSAAFVESALSASDMIGQVDFVLSEYASHASNVFKLQAKAATSDPGNSINLYDYYADEIAATAAWSVKTGAGYTTSVTLTSVAKNSANKGWDITLDNTEFGALSSGAKLKFSLVSPASLEAIDVFEVESIAVIATK